MVPEEGLDQNRTPSQGSLVGPRVTSTFCPIMSCGARACRAYRRSTGTGARRPCPVSPQAMEPESGVTRVTPREARAVQLACVAAFIHMRGFMAGAASTGPLKARICA